MTTHAKGAKTDQDEQPAALVGATAGRDRLAHPGHVRPVRKLTRGAKTGQIGRNVERRLTIAAKPQNGRIGFVRDSHRVGIFGACATRIVNGQHPAASAKVGIVPHLRLVVGSDTSAPCPRPPAAIHTVALEGPGTGDLRKFDRSRGPVGIGTQQRREIASGHDADAVTWTVTVAGSAPSTVAVKVQAWSPLASM